MGLPSGLSNIDLPQSHSVDCGPIRILLAEPDATSSRLIRAVLRDEPGVTLDLVDQNELIASVQKRSPDIVILDGHWPMMRRAESWESLGALPPPATIVTAYDASSVSSFVSSGIGLLIKPFSVEDLQSALELAKLRIARLRSENQSRAVAVETEDAIQRPQFLHRLAIDAGEKIVMVRTADIEWILSAGNQIRLHVGKTSHLVRQSMKRIEVLLDPSRFVRVHRNAIVNLDHVEEFHLPTIGNMFVKLRSGACLPLRKASRTLLRKMLIHRSATKIS